MHGPICGEDFAWKRPADQPLANEVANCYIHHIGEMDWGAGGILSSFCGKTRISHNLIEHVPYGGIAASLAVFAFSPGWPEEVTVEYNHIHHAVEKLFDTGGIYTQGIASSPCNLSVIRGNLIHDVSTDPYLNNGIFFDDNSHGCRVEDNIIYGVKLPVRFNGTEPGRFSFGRNYLNVAPASRDYPRDLAAKAGPVEPYKSLLQAR